MRIRLKYLALTVAAFAAACDGTPANLDEQTSEPSLEAPPASLARVQESKIGPGVRDAIQSDGEAFVIIALDAPGVRAAVGRGQVDLPALQRSVSAAQGEVLQTLEGRGFALGRQYSAVPALSMRINALGALERMARHPRVLRIDLDTGFSGTLGGSVPLIGADQRHAIGNDGEGVVVAVLDTGIDTDHPSLSDDLDYEACFQSPAATRTCPNGLTSQTGAGAAEDGSGHGTHVSGIITSNGSVGDPGVAPGANLVVIRVLDRSSFAGSGSWDDLIAALNHLIAHPELGVDVINMSLGGGLFTGLCDAADATAVSLFTAINTLRATGVTPFAASGNDASGTGMGMPACLSNVISVGATTDADIVRGNSNTNALTDMLAPGDQIVSMAIGGGTTTVSGTSMATPHAAGCAALLIDAGEATTPAAIETRLETSGVMVTDIKNGLTFPRIDCSATPGIITISKETVPEGRTGFSFTHDIDGSGGFTLDDNWSEVFLDVVPGTYTVTELDPGTYFALTDITCTDPSGGTTFNLPTRTANIDLAPGETVQCVFTNTDQPPDVTVDPSAQVVQYSDPFGDISVTAMDSDQDVLTADWSWAVDGGVFTAGLPDGFNHTYVGCSTTAPGVQTCIWTITGIADIPAGGYTIRTTVTDDDGSSTAADVTVTAQPEDATVTFDGDNPVAVEVDGPGGDSPPFALTVFVEETEPDEPFGTAEPGDISLAVVYMTLAPVGPGPGVAGTCTPMGVTGTGYGQVLEVECAFDDIPVNTYAAQVTVDGGYYTGFDEDVLTVFDPSLGFTTGGGWFYWPGTADRTNFGYTMKYNKKGTNVKGSLLLIRHLPDGTKYRVKSNALYGLALGNAGAFDWASFSGKATYLEPGWPEPEGNHSFVAYVEDHGEPGRGVDQFWIEVMDRDGNVISAASMARDATDNAETLQGGNIVVPHQGDGEDG